MLIAIGVHGFLMISDVWGSPLVAWIWLLVELEPKKCATDSCGSCEQMVIGAIPPSLLLLRIFRDSSLGSMSKAIPASQPSNFEEFCKISLLVACCTSINLQRIHPAADRATVQPRGRPSLERWWQCLLPVDRTEAKNLSCHSLAGNSGDICWIYLWISLTPFFLTQKNTLDLIGCEIWVLIVTTKACTLLLGASKGGGRASRRLCSYLPQQAGFQNYHTGRR